MHLPDIEDEARGGRAGGYLNKPVAGGCAVGNDHRSFTFFAVYKQYLTNMGGAGRGGVI